MKRKRLRGRRLRVPRRRDRFPVPLTPTPYKADNRHRGGAFQAAAGVSEDPGSMSKGGRSETARALAGIPSGLFVIAAAWDNKRRAARVTWVQQCGFEPPLVCVALPKGHCLAPLLQDARAFGLSQLAEEDSLLFRRFRDADADPQDEFDDVETFTLETGAPLLRRAAAALDCVVSRRMDLDSDHELLVGQVVAARMGEGTPAVRRREDGMAY